MIAHVQTAGLALRNERSNSPCQAITAQRTEESFAEHGYASPMPPAVT